MRSTGRRRPHERQNHVHNAVCSGTTVEIRVNTGCSEPHVVGGHDRVSLLQPVTQMRRGPFEWNTAARRTLIRDTHRPVRVGDDRPTTLGRSSLWAIHHTGTRHRRILRARRPVRHLRCAHGTRDHPVGTEQLLTHDSTRSIVRFRSGRRRNCQRHQRTRTQSDERPTQSLTHVLLLPIAVTMHMW